MEHFLQIIADWWVLWLMGVICTAVVCRFRSLKRRQKALELGVQALLRDRLVQSYYHYKERGNITLQGLENVNRMYKEYHNLGGNGSVTKIVNDMRKMEVVDE